MEDMSTSTWFMHKYLSWQKDNGKLSSMAEFARFLKVGDKALNTWMNGRNNPSAPTATQVCEILGDFSLLDILNYPKPATSQLPPDFRIRLAKATNETDRVLRERNLTGEMPEAEKVTIEIFERYGFKYTDTKID